MSFDANRKFSFRCNKCKVTIQADISDIGASMECDCGAHNTVPLPRVKITEERPGAAQPPRVAKPQQPTQSHVDVVSPLSGAKSDPDSDVTLSVEPPIPPSAEVPNKEQQDKEGIGKKPAKAVFYGGAFAIGFLMIWALKNGFSSDSPPLRVDGQSGTESAVIGHEQVRNLLAFQRAALLSRESIDMDLAISLAEMNARGMVDQAKIVQAAIYKKEQAIESARTRFQLTFQALLDAYDNDPDATLSLFSRVANEAELNANPDALWFITNLRQVVEENGDDASLAMTQANNFFGAVAQNK